MQAKLQRRRHELTQTTPDQPVDDEAVYYKVKCECPKGRVYGLGSLGRKKRRYADADASTSQLVKVVAITPEHTRLGWELNVLSLQSTYGSYLTLPHYIFPCATNYMIPGLPDGVTGVAGLGRSRISLPSQLSLAFGLDKKFAICLPSSSKAKGFIVFGNNGIDTSYLHLTYTPLLSNPVSTVIAPRGNPLTSTSSE
ncbi:hypothetical protein Syun_029068 [Stephania yunnanensis]|uniref:Xylanase inhibitor N-terminal domain-containing protein n=1 Tax=Stephania yunnanensis TaxID=152371 RepID=A0AAP0E4W1_9MAGN